MGITDSGKFVPCDENNAEKCGHNSWVHDTFHWLSKRLPSGKGEDDTAIHTSMPMKGPPISAIQLCMPTTVLSHRSPSMLGLDRGVALAGGGKKPKTESAA